MQQFFFGEKSIEKMRDELCRIAPQKVLLLRGKNSYEQSGARRIFEEILRTLNCGVVEWFDFAENPKIEDVERGLAVVRSCKIDVIIAVGGGSVIDMAKLVRFFFSHLGDWTGSSFEKIKESIPLFALPTTAGTGAEATHFAVCYKNKEKFSVAHKDMVPDYAVVYPPFTYDNSPYLTACTGFDALAQAIEAYWNVNAIPESDQYAEKAFISLWDSLPRLVASGDRTLRTVVAESSYYSGRAINITKTTAPHAFSYAFTSFCGYPHGHAVSLTFPFFAALNMNCDGPRLQASLSAAFYRKKMMRLKKILGLKLEENIQEFFLGFISSIGLKNNGYGTFSVPELLSKVNHQRLNNNPVIVTDEELALLNEFLEKR